MSKADIHRLVDALPDDLIRRIEDGVPVTLAVTPEYGQLELREIAPEQVWFWTPEWQEGESEADDDVATGRVTRYFSDEELLSAHEAHLKPLSE